MPVNELFNNRPGRYRKNTLPDNPEGGGAGRFPSWLHRSLPRGGALPDTTRTLSKHRLNTVCEEAKCPNRLECYTNGTATFLALGSACTRACGFCDIAFSATPPPPEEDEPDRIADASLSLGLKHVVVTMVARDDIPDKGSGHIVRIIRAVRLKNPNTTVEVLTSDFAGEKEALDKVIGAEPDIFNHNIETVRRLTPSVRHRATYDRTLTLLRYVKGKVPFLKSGIMVGLGETGEEVESTIDDLAEVGCDIVTIGQYLQASRNKLRVKAFIPPGRFAEYERYGLQAGIGYVYSGPFVRSSYNAGLLREKLVRQHSREE